MVIRSQKEIQATMPRVVRSGASLILIRLLGVAFTFLTTILITRSLGVQSYGHYAFIFGIVTLASIPTQMGLPDLVVRETAKAVGSMELDKFRAVLKWAQFYLAVSSVVVIGAILGWGSLTQQPDLLSLALASLLIPLTALGNVRGAALRGLGHDVLGQLPEYLFRPLLFFVATALLALFSGTIELHLVFLAQVSAALGAFLIGLAILKKVDPKPSISTASQKEKAHWRTAWFSLAGISGLTVINSSIDVVMLGIWSSDIEVGQYRLAVTVGAFFTLGLQTMNTFSMSYMSIHLELKDTAKLRKLLQRSCQFSFALACAGFLVALLISSAGLEWVFGTGFGASFPILIMLAVGHLTNAFFGPVTSLLTMAGQERTVVKVSALGAGANIILNLILIPSQGAIGAAAAASVSIILVRIVLFQIAQRTLTVRCWPLAP